MSVIRGIPQMRRGRGWAALAFALFCGCTLTAPARSQPIPAAVPPISAGEARIWIYRDFLPGESMSLAAVSINGGLIGYAAAGTSFYRDVPAGHYLVTVESYGRDDYQDQDLTVAAGEQDYVKIMSLASWMEARPNFERPTYYARAVSPRLAALEMPLTRYRGGN